ncbi:MAG: hypothetical protein WDM92_16250 [Caulobacteraceae bacterium]
MTPAARLAAAIAVLGEIEERHKPRPSRPEGLGRRRALRRLQGPSLGVGPRPGRPAAQALPGLDDRP